MAKNWFVAIENFGSKNNIKASQQLQGEDFRQRTYLPLRMKRLA